MQSNSTTKQRAKRVTSGSAAGVLLGAVIGLAVSALDATLTTELPAPLRLDVEHASTLLGTLAGGIITVAVFSLWMRTVMVGLVSTELSPRLLAAYLEDRFQERVTYVMLGGLAFVCVVLFTAPEEVAPLIGTTISVLLALAALVTVLFAIQHAVRSLSPSQVIRDLTDAILAMIRELPRGEDQHEQPDLPGSDTDHATVYADQLGWVVDVDLARLLAALASGSTAWVVTPIGSFLRPGHPVVTADQPPLDSDEVRASITLRSSREPTSTLGFAIDQLVDVAQHALLSNENDASTAHEVLLHLAVVIEALLDHSPEPRVHRGERDRRVVTPPEPSASDHVGRSFRRLRPGASKQLEASRDVLETMGTINRAAERADDVETCRVIRREAESLLQLHELGGHMTHTERTELHDLARHLLGAESEVEPPRQRR